MRLVKCLLLDLRIENLIEEDVKRIANAGSKVQRIKSLRDYYENPNYCKQCGKLIEVPLGKKAKEAKTKVFCSRSCSAKYNNALLDPAVRRGPLPFAVMCSNEDFVSFYEQSSTIDELCSKLGYKQSGGGSHQVKKRMASLGLESYSSKRVKEKSIELKTKGELISKSKYWSEWRSLVQRHARKMQANSDKPKKCQICGYDLTYEVAHIKSVSSFDEETTVAEMNNINNLIALCPNHHWEYDHGLIDLLDINV